MIIFQCAHGRHAELVELTRQHHARLFPRDTWRVILNSLHIDFRPTWHGGWNRTLWLRDLMHELPDGTELVSLDADLVALESFAFSDACPEEFDLAGVRNIGGHINIGANFWRVSERSRRVLDTACSAGRGIGSDQPHINHRLGHLKVRTLGRDWNQYRHSIGETTGKTIIKAFHGEGVEVARREIKTLLDRAA